MSRMKTAPRQGVVNIEGTGISGGLQMPSWLTEPKPVPHTAVIIKFVNGCRVKDLESLVNQAIAPVSVRNFIPLYPGTEDRELKMVFKCDVPLEKIGKVIRLLKRTDRVEYAQEPVERPAPTS